MKNVILILMVVSLAFARAQKPEKIYPNAREHKSISYLKEQSAAWKKVTEEDPKNVSAWYNYYYANRNLQFNDTTDKRSMDEKTAGMNKIIDEMEKKIPDSYEFNLVKWQNGGWNMKLLPYLKKAMELGPDRTEHLDFSIVLNEIEGKTDQRDFYSKKKNEAGQISTGMMYYNYNVLMGLPQNAILITCGDNDTYPVWLLQASGIRKDVQIVHLSLLYMEEYQQAIIQKLGIAKYDLYKAKNMDSAKSVHKKYKSEIVEHIVANKKGYPVCVALTAASDDYTEKINDKLYLTGLAYQYSKTSLDNIAVLKKNFEQNYALDYIENAFYQDISPGIVSMVNCNYVVPMLKLFDHYKTAGDKQKEEWIKQKLLTVSKGKPDEQKIKKHLDLN